MADQHLCPSCERSFGSKGALTRHVRSDHTDDALIALQAQFGTIAPYAGGAWHPRRPLQALPTGIPSVDYMTGIGGLPKGAMVEVYGQPDVGKTAFALGVAAYAQQHGELASYVDVEKHFDSSIAKMIPGLDLDALYYSKPKLGDSALEITSEFVETGLFGVWIVDSVKACTPQALLDTKIGDTAALAALARLMSHACDKFVKNLHDVDTVLIFVNHVKSVPAVRYGKDWSKPGGSALDYATSLQLGMERRHLFHDEHGTLLGQTVKVRVDRSKVAAPHNSATYDIFVAPGKIKKAGHERNGQVVVPGVDIGSSWFSVAEEAQEIIKVPKGFFDTSSGEIIGSQREVAEMLREDCDLRRRCSELVYSKYAREYIEEQV